jgi:exopolysaccharide biosynthesis polyprenyl glycosylphosphotransferase
MSVTPRIGRLPAVPSGYRTTAVAALGRTALVALAIAVVAATHRPLGATGLLGVGLAALLWTAALHSAFSAVELSLGVAVPTLVGTSTGLVLVAAVNPWVPGLDVSLPALLGMAAGVFASVALWETAVARVTTKRRVLVIGTQALDDIAAEAGRIPRARFEVLAPPVPGPGPAALPDLTAVILAQRPTLIVVADESDSADLIDRLLDMPRSRVRLAGFTSFYEYAFGRVPLSHLTPMWFMSLLEIGKRSYGGWSKRAFDIGGALFVLALAAPLMALIAVVLRTTHGPVLYRQVRVGDGGRRFKICKFRTMRVDAEQPGEARWAVERDPRVTRLGLILRRSHFDELPQLWNVLKGDMSLVGPRPERPEFIATLEQTIPFWSRRLLVKPGITGWAQLRCGYTSDAKSAAEKLSYDFWYIRHRTLVVDVALCVRTALLVLAAFDPRALRRHLRARADR